jgi:outer membrane murein-binding lipoprotein Lpp
MHFIGSKRPYDEWQILSKSCDEGPSTLSTWPFFLTFFNRPLLVAIRDEKSTLLSQISTLQAQQAALEIRLESVSQTADNAMEREREAEDRLDAALSMHARQLTQRQVSHIACVSMY